MKTIYVVMGGRSAPLPGLGAAYSSRLAADRHAKENGGTVREGELLEGESLVLEPSLVYIR